MLHSVCGAPEASQVNRAEVAVDRAAGPCVIVIDRRRWHALPRP
jgi:hypothetical protein